ncbi:hypothetical protein LG3211_2642 [Lysobacter gummosus]|nr:hypothetical protein LG3211_2642 [Lysobacter gummosus]
MHGQSSRSGLRGLRGVPADSDWTRRRDQSLHSRVGHAS